MAKCITGFRSYSRGAEFRESGGRSEPRAESHGRDQYGTNNNYQSDSRNGIIIITY
uniref:Uncharacterized protein n=1 Tax=Heterorhabditis bacteriophora TaxID=37862 RepID=A0A1I7XA21_HETBA